MDPQHDTQRTAAPPVRVSDEAPARLHLFSSDVRVVETRRSGQAPDALQTTPDGRGVGGDTAS